MSDLVEKLKKDQQECGACGLIRYSCTTWEYKEITRRKPSGESYLQLMCPWCFEDYLWFRPNPSIADIQKPTGAE